MLRSFEMYNSLRSGKALQYDHWLDQLLPNFVQSIPCFFYSFTDILINIKMCL